MTLTLQPTDLDRALTPSADPLLRVTAHRRMPDRRPSRRPGEIGAVAVTPSVLDMGEPESVETVLAGGAVGAGRVVETDRFDRRRAQIAKERARIVARPAVLLTIAALAVLGGIAALFSPLLSVREIEVRGADTLSKPAVDAAVSSLRSKPLLFVSERAVAARVVRMAQVPSARVTKDWPDRIIVEVTQRLPVAVLRTVSAGDQVVDALGRPLALAPDPTLPVVTSSLKSVGSKDASVEASRLLAGVGIVEALGPQARSRLHRIDHEGDAYQLQFGKAEVRYGRADDHAAKAAALETLAATGELDGKVSVDVSVPDTVIVAPRAATRSS